MKQQITTLLLFFTMTTFAQNMYIAHRGASYLALENTVASAKLAWERGADAVECDIYLTKDNRVMVIHDKDTKRTCSGKKNLSIADSPSMLLRDLDAGSWKDEKYKGEKIPFLSELIETVPAEKTLVVEIKCNSDVLPHLKRVVENSGKADQIVFIAFDWNTIVATKKEFPDNKCYWLSSSKSAVKRKLPEVAAEGLEGVNLSHGIVDKEIVALAKEHNLEVLAWTVDDPTEVKRLTDLGVTKITTNRPKWLKEELAKL
jgi:glycerophosphoryl diester phosphodiesterase